MEGEPKKEMYDLLPSSVYPKTFNVLPGEAMKSIENKFITYMMQFPVIVKPEVGGQGILLRKIDSQEQLLNYHKKNPFEYIVQQFVHYPMEVSIFYYRYPDETTGHITGFLHKIPLLVTGDGIHSLRELIQLHPKATKYITELQKSHGKNFDTILPPGGEYKLSYAANHNRGASFIDLKNDIDQKLISVIDSISNYVNDFFYGRYDIMCSSVEDLKENKNFTILEYNGCGAEPNHFYDTGYTLLGAYKEILMHWKVLYEISLQNHKKGIPYWPLKKGTRFLKETRKYYAQMKEADKLI